MIFFVLSASIISCTRYLRQSCGRYICSFKEKSGYNKGILKVLRHKRAPEKQQPAQMSLERNVLDERVLSKGHNDKN